MSVAIKKVSLTASPVRPRTDEALIVTRANGDCVRYEFDYDETHIFVYTGIWPAGWPDGYGCKEQLPVRAYRRRNSI